MAKIAEHITRLIIATVLMTTGLSQSVAADDGIYILETRSNKNSDEFFSAFLAACPECKNARKFDAKGDGKTLERRAKEIASQKPRLVIATGAPAIEMLLSDENMSSPILATLTSRQKLPNNSESVFGQSLDLPIVWSLEIAQSVFGNEVSFAFVASDAFLKSERQEFEELRLKYPNLKVYNVISQAALPNMVERAYRENDVVIFGKDSGVMNRQSLEYIRSTSVKYNKPTIVNSASLITKGFPIAITHNMEDLGSKAGQFASDFLNNSTNALRVEISDFRILVDCRVLARNVDLSKLNQNICTAQSVRVEDHGFIRVLKP